MVFNTSKNKKYKVSDYGKVAVMMGGFSAEREISLESGQAVHNALVRAGIDTYAVDMQKDILKKLSEEKFDRIFIALHGRGGEDGQIQGALEILQIPYTGSGVLGSALAMDKCRTKNIWQSHGLPTPSFVELNKRSNWHDVAEKLGLPLMVKPVHEGSSFGASKVMEVDELEYAWKLACQFDDFVMAERWISGSELTVPILNDKALPIIRLVTPRTFYDFKAKYELDSTQYICPCGLDKKQEKTLGDLALTAFKVLDASGWGRIDLILDEGDQPWLIEANTIPGMTSHSLVPMAAKQAGLAFDELAIEILNTSMDK
jgi:D-alanine-D-alanine ligase